MNATATPRYGFEPAVPFAATRAFAERSAAARAAASASARPARRTTSQVLSGLVNRLAALR